MRAGSAALFRDELKKNSMETVPDSPKRYRTAADDITGWRIYALEELVRLNGESYARKRKDTIIALVDAHLAGRAEETVWSLPGTCARTTYHDVWKKDPLFADVLRNVDRIANEWMDRRQVDALAEAASILRVESPDSVRAAVELRDKSEDDRVRLQAAFGILDRAGVETAPKNSTTHEVQGDVADAISRIYGSTDEGDDE